MQTASATTGRRNGRAERGERSNANEEIDRPPRPRPARRQLQRSEIQTYHCLPKQAEKG